LGSVSQLWAANRVVLKREDPLVRPVGVGQELAQSVGVLERRCLQRLEPPALIDLRHLAHDAALGGQVATAPVGEAAGIAGEGALRGV
jgi:hypothetical protein